MKANIKDIAKLAGVSTATVSRAFSGKNYVREDTRQEILKIAKEHGFTPKVYKKNTLKSVYRSTVGVILPQLDNNFYYEIIKGIDSTLNQYDIDVLHCCSWNDPQKEMMYIDLFDKIKPSGLIIVPTSEKHEENKAYLREIANDMNIIILDRELKGENLDGVFMNNFASSYQGTKLLIDQGHRNIAFVCGATESTSGMERLRGYKQALEDNNIPYNRDYILYGDFKYQTAYEVTKEFLKGKKKVTAFFSSSSTMSYGCLLAIAEKGLSIPEDIGFLTYGYSEWKNKNISYLRYPGTEMGKECAKILLERLKNKSHKKSAPKKRSIFEVAIELNGSEKFNNM